MSDDAISTAHALARQGVPSDRIADDSCARTTWENAISTADWLRHHHLGSPVLLITDLWQLTRASAAFRPEVFTFQPILAEPAITATQRNRLALRETAGTLLYRLQGRF